MTYFEKLLRAGHVLVLSLPLLFLQGPAVAQIIHQEGFNTDGDGERYFMEGRGQEVLDVGPGMWEHNFNVDVVGLPATAPGRRAAILWDNELIEDDFTDASLAIWTNLINYMIDGKENATIGWVTDSLPNTPDFLAFMLEDEGHSNVDLGSPAKADLDGIDLVIQTNAGNPNPGTLFADADVTTPVITYNAGNHDDTLTSSIGAVTAGGPTMVTINEAQKDHPVLGGAFEGEVQWIDDFSADLPLQGIGGATPAGASILATYVEPTTGLTLPAVLVVEQGDPLLGAFAPVPEGEGYIVGGDLNEAFGGGTFTDENNPRTLTLVPVDVADKTDVKLSVDLAATTVDFEPVDFVRVSYAPDENSDFVVLGDFHGLDDPASTDNKSLVDISEAQLGALKADAFRTFTFDIPDEATNLVVKFEAYSTFPNEVLGIDNVVIFAPVPIDCNGDGVVTAADLDCSNEAGITADVLAELNLLPGDLDGMNGVDFADFLTLSANFGSADATKYTQGDIDGMGGVAFADFLLLSENFGKTAAGAAAVPEPTGLGLWLMACLVLGCRRRRP